MQKVLPLNWLYGGSAPTSNPFLKEAYEPAEPWADTQRRLKGDFMMTAPFATDVPLDKVRAQIAIGSMVALRDGRIMWIWGDGRLWANFSTDGGRSWSDAVPCRYDHGGQIPGGVVSLIRLASGDLGMSQAIDDREHIRRFSFHVSKDEGRTWSAPVHINPPDRRESPMMNSLIQLSTGRLLQPCHVVMGPAPTASEPNVAYRFGRRFHTCWAYQVMFCFCYYSDDGGRTWQRSDNEVHATIDRGVAGGYSMAEPKAVELADGRVLLMANTSLGRLYRSYSEDQGRTWLEAEPTDLVQRRSPLNLKRIADSSDLLVIWNQLSNWEQMNGLHRHRLSCAVSGDHGLTWRHHKNLESLDDTSRLEPEPLASWLLGAGSGHFQPLDRVRYHRAPGPLRNDHPCCLFHDGHAIISYGVNVLGDPNVIEKTYGMDIEQVARQLGFSHTASSGDPKQPREKWYEGFNRVRVIPIEWFYT